MDPSQSKENQRLYVPVTEEMVAAFLPNFLTDMGFSVIKSVIPLLQRDFSEKTRAAIEETNKTATEFAESEKRKYNQQVEASNKKIEELTRILQEQRNQLGAMGNEHRLVRDENERLHAEIAQKENVLQRETCTMQKLKLQSLELLKKLNKQLDGPTCEPAHMIQPIKLKLPSSKVCILASFF
jgi:hypothetical protein